uniref:NAD(P)H-hydrate epimerase n=1 Tax=Chitinimonas sp. TaxID=1934313 RepID=UPI0035B022C2
MFHTVAQLRQIEQLALARQLPLMQRAGAAAADCIAAQGAGPVLLLVGPGNNGGDALVAARLLQSRGIAVAVLMPGDTDQLPADAAAAYRDWLAVGGTIHKVWPAGPWTMLVDGLFGIGLNRPLQPYWQAIIDQANAQALPTLALDVPSGIHADTGAALGRPIRADWTLSFIGTARGLLTGAACNVVGQRLLARLDVPEELLANGELASCATISAEMQLDRPSDSHKGRFGTLAIIGGAAGMVGAALLAGRAALHAGAGKVYAGLLDPQGPSVDFARPELMLRPATAELMDQASTIAIGPGLGVSAEARRLLRHALASSQPLLLDADALNLIAEDAALRQTLAIRPAVTILTPHPSEAARLLACSTAAIQADRYGAARQLASLFAATIVLK